MYHDTILIAIEGANSGVSFDYVFEISTNSNNVADSKFYFDEIPYRELLNRFDTIGIASRFIIFPTLDSDSVTVYASYNHMDNIDIFFKFFSKCKNSIDKITFSYGNKLIDSTSGRVGFVLNNINFYSEIDFINSTYENTNTRLQAKYNFLVDNLVIGSKFYINAQLFNIIDKKGNFISSHLVDWNINPLDLLNSPYENIYSVGVEFFKRPEVQVFLRKAKLSILNEL